MAQHDYQISNAPGATVRSDINSAFNAIATNNSGTTAPSTTYALMWWFDTTNNILKIRDASDANWVNVASLSGTTWVPYSGGQTLSIGTSNGDIPQFDATGYPAADASQLTDLTAANVLLSALPQSTVIDGANDLIFTYNATASANRAVTPEALGIAVTGMIMMWSTTTAPTGWVLLEGGTIGSGASGATERANADTEALFKHIWDNYADAQAAVSGGRGASAQADFDADKTITLPDYKRAGPMGLDASAPFDAMGKTGGEEEHTQTLDELVAHTHPQRHDTNSTGGATAASAAAQADTDGDSTASTGGGNPFNVLDPFVVNVFIMKL